jgi:transposase
VPRQKRVFTPEYRTEAVQLVLAADKPIAEIARDLGIGESTLGNWVAKAKENGVVHDKPLDVNERAELKRLRDRLRPDPGRSMFSPLSKAAPQGDDRLEPSTACERIGKPCRLESRRDLEAGPGNNWRKQ